jgi:putative phosphoesterase
MESLRIGLLSDTHGHMDDRILHHLKGCDEIWHAGDIGDLAVTDQLAKIAPLRVVYGNIDGAEIRTDCPEYLRFEAGGARIWMTHIGGRPGRYAAGIRAGLMTVRPDFFVCGHSHLLRVGRDKSWGGVYVNPGAAGHHGIHNVRTLLRFTLTMGKMDKLEVVELGSR